MILRATDMRLLIKLFRDIAKLHLTTVDFGISEVLGFDLSPIN